MKPANTKARALLAKLERLADPANGATDGEAAAAKRKLARLKSRFDFAAREQSSAKDIFAGFKFTRRVGSSAHVYTFQAAEFDIANSVKWAIETATGLRCHFRGGDLLVEAAPSTANRLSKLAGNIAESFRALLDRLGGLNGVTVQDRTVFVMGLYDGMMNEGRKTGHKLPNRLARPPKRAKAKKGAVAGAPGISIHPYTVALELGRQIRFAAPVEQITAELERATQPASIPLSASL
ncbi:MAG: hypothetical protein ACLQVY_02870 [Limisphaerales bacterium]